MKNIKKVDTVKRKRVTKKVVSDTKAIIDNIYTTNDVKKGIKNRFYAKKVAILFIQLLIALFIFLWIDHTVTDYIKIQELEQKITEQQNSTFLENKDGDRELQVQNKYGEIVKYKGVYVNNEILKRVDQKFGKDAEIFKAIIVIETTKNGQILPDTVNYNCRYDNQGNLKIDGTGYSTFCKSSYHAIIGADSVDCGYLQLNFKGNKCPAGIFEPQKQVDVAYEKYTNGGCGGLNCWSSYKLYRQRVINVINKEQKT